MRGKSLSRSKLVSFGSFELRLNHLLVISILAISFSTSFLIRSQAADFGFELYEFDPFFNYRATEYLLDNGIDAYFNWNDDLSWYPLGRDVSATSQVMLHMTAAFTYYLFGANSSLYDFTVVFPVVFGSLSSIVIFALVRVIGGTTAGLIASLLFSLSLPIVIRGPIGWFKSEPLGIFFGLLCTYFLLSGISSKNPKIAAGKIAAGGIFATFAISAWGGNQFFIIPIGVFFLALPFLRDDHRFLIWSIPLFTIATLVSSFGFERGISFDSLGGIVLLTTTIFLAICIVIQKKSSKNKRRNGLLFLSAFLIIGSSFLLVSFEYDLLPLPSHRYMNALNPFLTTTDPLVDSISEHATTTLQQSFLFHSVLMLFAGLGVWLLIQNIQKKDSSSPSFVKNDMLSFALILGFFGAYVSSAFIRLEVFASLSIIVLSSLGISFLLREFASSNKVQIKKLIKFPFFAGLIFLLIAPLVYPADSNVFSLSKSPPTILNGGTAYAMATNDWPEALDWIKNNTPKDAVIASWWDYGYWIQTLGERATLADNSTLITEVIQNIARILLGTNDESWNLLNDMGADYVLVFVAYNKLSIGSTEQEFFTVTGGGDESKKQWYMRIAGYPESKFVHSDGSSGTDYFWNETLLGQMFPFTVLGYVNPNDIQRQSSIYIPGMIPIYSKDIKFPEDGDGPLRFRYASPSFYDGSIGPKIGIFIYEVNDEYVQSPSKNT